MKAVTHWNFAPYTPLDRPERARRPYVCRVAPEAGAFELELLDNGGRSGDTHTLFYRKREGEEDYTSLPLGLKTAARVEGLDDLTDYEFFLRRDRDGEESEHRLCRTGETHGRVVNYLHPEDPAYVFSGRFLCSPSLLRLPSGRLLSSMDVFGKGTAQDLSMIFYSDDEGESWHYLTELFPCFWGKLFYRNGRLYMLSCSTGFGDLLIGASDNGGRDWTMPTVLFRGAGRANERGMHRGPMPICEHDGRIWTDVQFGSWVQSEMNCAVLSAPADCEDYTDPSVWTVTDVWRYAEQMQDEPLREPGAAGALEGTLVVSPEGKLYDFLRYARGKSLLLSVDTEDPEKMPAFAGIAEMPVIPSKFEIHRDEKTGDYYAICSRALEEPCTNRNLLALFRSADLWHWEWVRDLIDERDRPPQMTGFQYVSFLIEGDDILFLSRTAWNEPENYHNSNYQTFHRVRNFRERE